MGSSSRLDSIYVGRISRRLQVARTACANVENPKSEARNPKGNRVSFFEFPVSDF